MRVLALGLVVSAHLFLGTPALAADSEPRTGNWLLGKCDKGNSNTDFWECLGYITGVLDAQTSAQACIPERVTFGQLTDIIVGDLKAQPSTRHLHAWVLIAASAARAFPCPKSTP